MILTFLAFLVVLGVLIFIHELGHFAAAKWAGIYVHRFSLGMGAPIKALTFRRGETEYAVSWLPLGGYVKMASREEEALSSSLEGEQPAAAVPPDRMFEAKPVWKRMIVILAGVTMNFLFAYLVFSGLALGTGRVDRPDTRVGEVIPELVPPGGEMLRTVRPGDRVVTVDGDSVRGWADVMDGIQNTGSEQVRIGLADGRTIALDIHPDAIAERVQAAQALQPWQDAVVDSVVPGGGAAAAGVMAGDSVIAIAGERIRNWSDLRRVVEARPAEVVDLTVVREGQQVALSARTDTMSVPDTAGGTQLRGVLGVVVRQDFVTEPYTVGGALAEGWRQTVSASGQIFRTVRGLLSGRVAGRELGGPILIGQLAGQTARMGLEPFLAFMALISVNLAILNLLPIPLLDGGQFLFLLAEGILRRPLSLKLRERLAQVGFVMLILIMLLAFSNDIRRVVEGLL